MTTTPSRRLPPTSLHRDAPRRSEPTAGAMAVGSLPVPALLLLVAAFALRVWSLGKASLWLDEALIILRASESLWTAVAGRTSVDLEPPLYPVLLRLWQPLGAPDFWARFLSVAFVTLAVAVLLRLSDRRVGYAAAAIMAFAPTQVYYAQEATVYGLVALLSAGLLVAADRAAHGSRRGWLAFAAFAVAAIHTYYGLVFLVVGLDAWLLTRRWRGDGASQSVSTRALLVGHAVVVLAWLPLLPLALRQSNAVVDVWWGRYGQISGWQTINLFIDGAVHDGLLFPIFAFTSPPLWFLMALTALLLVGARYRPGWFVGGWLLPLLLAYLASIIGRYPFGAHYLFIVAPVVYALLGAAIVEGTARLGQPGARRARPALARWMSTTAILVALVVLASGLPSGGLARVWPGAMPHSSTRDILLTVGAQRRATDAIFVTYGAGPVARVYQARGITPPDAEIEAGWPAGHIDGQVGRVLAAARDHDRVWVVVTPARPGEEEALAFALARRGAWLRQRVTAPGTVALLFDLAP